MRGSRGFTFGLGGTRRRMLLRWRSVRSRERTWTLRRSLSLPSLVGGITERVEGSRGAGDCAGVACVDVAGVAAVPRFRLRNLGSRIRGSQNGRQEGVLRCAVGVQEHPCWE